MGPKVILVNYGRVIIYGIHTLAFYKVKGERHVRCLYYSLKLVAYA
jgi:hypothetical protein